MLKLGVGGGDAGPIERTLRLKKPHVRIRCPKCWQLDGDMGNWDDGNGGGGSGNVCSHCGSDSSRDLELDRCLSGGRGGGGFIVHDSYDRKKKMWPGVGAGWTKESRLTGRRPPKKNTAGGVTKQTTKLMNRRACQIFEK